MFAGTSFQEPLLADQRGESQSPSIETISEPIRKAKEALEAYQATATAKGQSQAIINFKRLELSSTLIDTLATYATSQSNKTVPFDTVEDRSDAKAFLAATRTASPVDEADTKPALDEAVFNAHIKGRAEHFRDAAAFFYESGVVIEPEKSDSSHAAFIAARNTFNEGVTTAFKAWQTTHAAAETPEAHKAAMKTLFNTLNNLLKTATQAVYGRRAKAVTMQVMGAVYTMHLQTKFTAEVDPPSTDIVTTLDLISEAKDSPDSTFVDLERIELREKQIRHFRPDQIAELLLILEADTRHPKWFKKMSAWHKAYLQKIVTDEVRASEEAVGRPFGPMSLKNRLEKALAAPPSTLRVFGLANAYEHIATANHTGHRTTVKVMRASCPMPDPKFVKDPEEWLRLTEANLRQYIFAALEAILKEDGGYYSEDGVEHILCTELSVLSALGLDSAFTPLNDNNLKMMEITREAMARVKLECTGPILVKGRLVEVHLAHTGHPVNYSRNARNGFAEQAQSPADEALILKYVAQYLRHQEPGTPFIRLLTDIATAGTRSPLEADQHTRLENAYDELSKTRPLLANALRNYIQLLAHNNTEDQHGLNIMLFRAAFEAIIISEVGGRSLIHCKSGQDRAGQVCYQIDAMLEYYMRYGKLPNPLTDTAEEIQKFIDIYITHFQKGHHAYVRAIGIPHSVGLKELKNIMHPAAYARLMDTPEAKTVLSYSTVLADISKPESSGGWNSWFKARAYDLGTLACCGPQYKGPSVTELTKQISATGLSLSTASVHIDPRLPPQLTRYLQDTVQHFVDDLHKSITNKDSWDKINQQFPAHVFARDAGLEAALVALIGASNAPTNIATARIWLANAEALFQRVATLLPRGADLDEKEDSAAAEAKTTALTPIHSYELAPNYTEATHKILAVLKGYRTLALDEITPALLEVLIKMKQADGDSTTPETAARATIPVAGVAMPNVHSNPLDEVALPNQLRKILRLIHAVATEAHASDSIGSLLCGILRYLTAGDAVYLATLLTAADKEIDKITFGAPRALKDGKNSLINSLGARNQFLKFALMKETRLTAEQASSIASSSRKPISFLKRYGLDLLFIGTKATNLSLYGVVMYLLAHNEQPGTPLLNGLTGTFYTAIIASALAVIPRGRAIPHLQAYLKAQSDITNKKDPSLGASVKKLAEFIGFFGLVGAWIGDSVGAASQANELKVLPFAGLGAAAGLQIASWLILSMTHQQAKGDTRKTIAAGGLLVAFAVDALATWAVDAMGYNNAIQFMLPVMLLLQAFTTSAYVCCKPSGEERTARILSFSPRAKNAEPEYLFLKNPVVNVTDDQDAKSADLHI